MTGNIIKAIENYRTTAAGAALGGTFYLSQMGALTIPRNRFEWANFAVSLLLFLLGALSKDGATGSAPS